MKHYIDFASASGFPYMLIDAGWAVADRKGPQDYAALADITRVGARDRHARAAALCQEKNVRLWLWSHWTSVDKYMDQAFPLFEQWGIAGVKIDFMNRGRSADGRLVSSRWSRWRRKHHLDDRLSWRLQARRPAPHMA